MAQVELRGVNKSFGKTEVIRNVELEINKGEFNHLCFILDRDDPLNRLKIYNNEDLKSTSNDSTNFGNLNIDFSDLVIGSGSTYYVGGSSIVPQQTLSGTIDELRIFHSVRTQQQQLSYAKKSIYATEDLKLYYRFNEPEPPLSPIVDDITNAIVLDSSGNSLHSYIINFSDGLRENANADATSNLIYERDDTCPILFPSHPDVINLNSNLLLSASNSSNNSKTINSFKFIFLGSNKVCGLSSTALIKPLQPWCANA